MLTVSDGKVGDGTGFISIFLLRQGDLNLYFYLCLVFLQMIKIVLKMRKSAIVYNPNLYFYMCWVFLQVTLVVLLVYL